ncbi:MAG: hypothetical protein JNM56_14810 [Planctomycetia bacterium]|nr:hypothetical protein [Planctomycetia bacterium]
MTVPTDQVPLALKEQQGQLLWKVHLRRGLIVVNGRDYSTRAVIDVEFDKEQIAGR